MVVEKQNLQSQDQETGAWDGAGRWQPPSRWSPLDAQGEGQAPLVQGPEASCEEGHFGATWAEGKLGQGE